MDIADGLLFSGSPAVSALHPFSSALSGGPSFSSPGPYEAPSVVADQILSPGLYESLPDQLVIFGFRYWISALCMAFSWGFTGTYTSSMVLGSRPV